jgi:hypothetical protein
VARVWKSARALTRRQQLVHVTARENQDPGSETEPGAPPDLISGGGVEGFLAAFDRDTLDLYLLREDSTFQAVGQNFYDFARFGKLGVISEQAHGFGLIAVHADVHFEDRLLALGDDLFHDN